MNLSEGISSASLESILTENSILDYYNLLLESINDYEVLDLYDQFTGDDVTGAYQDLLH